MKTNSPMLFDENLWKEWSRKVEVDFDAKKYTHFDFKFNFPSKKNQLYDLLKDPTNVARHSFLPFIKIKIKTPRYRYQENEREYGLETKIRPISFAAHLDTYLYSFYSYILNKKYQEYIHQIGVAESVLAYRNDLGGRCNIQFAKEVFDFIKSKGRCCALTLDIKGYFDSIDHILLKEKWCKVVGEKKLPEDEYAIYRSLTKYAYVNKTTFLKHFRVNLKSADKKQPNLLGYIPGESFEEKFQLLRDHNVITNNKTNELIGVRKRFFGIPQGSAISAVLSNVYLLDYDTYLCRLAKERGILYRRYCDDILIVCDTDQAMEIQMLAIDKIREYHLTIQDRKVEAIQFSSNSRGQIRAFNQKKIVSSENEAQDAGKESQYYKNLQYLGFEFNGKDVLIRSSSLSRYFRKMKAKIDKTIKMAYSDKGIGDRVFKQKLFHRYTHLGRRNFLRYAYNASQSVYMNAKRERKEGFDSPAIRKQLIRHFIILEKTLEKQNASRAKLKGKALKKI